ncbi:unnamed protein product [Didymodactylos carnosus]|uniref:Uncharacterized protein n=1 Tax=Didymodactylos carnosus TaxID=1234261 RepID=A0A815IES2_9BILA|nr:unnamed protein product [Didymodactylos carnosus]CAF1459320.1 unnamed protein product [Didymodactylos carnosus]CAF4250233.1 unnamed protein product [Didymodactylos carnosus]CAF4252986.1 unnamed protein product [Didymodactylos carnosus]
MTQTSIGEEKVELDEPPSAMVEDVKGIYIDPEQSSYEEIAGIVPNKDDSQMLCSTFRSWLIGISLTVLATIVSQYFRHGEKVYEIPSVLLWLLAFLLGKILMKCLPQKNFQIRRWNLSLNSEIFTIKEHVVICMMIRVATSYIYTNDIVVVHQTDFNQKTSYGLGLFFIISSQLMGYEIAELDSTGLKDLWSHMES